MSGLKPHAERVHVVCEYLLSSEAKERHCEECPHEFEHSLYGKCQHGCRGMAEEVMNVVLYGSLKAPKENG